MSRIELPKLDKHPFILDKEYVREVDPVNYSIDGAIHFISKYHNINVEDASKIIIKLLENQAKDPIVDCYKRKSNGDKYKTKIKLTQYIAEAYRLNEAIAPSFTRYSPSKEDGGVDSLHKQFTLKNLKERSIAKKGAATAYAQGDMFLSSALTNKQLVLKLMNNAMSGAFASPGTVHYNPSAHYTLTSITRVTASIGNVTTEMVSGGNRYYRNYEFIVSHIMTTIRGLDYDDFSNTMKQYNLHYINPQEALSIINHSSDLYFKSEYYNKLLINLLNKLDPVELSMFAYNNDLYHLHKYNPDFVNTMLLELSTKKQGRVPEDQQVDYINSQPGYVRNFVIHVCIDELKGMELKPEDMVGSAVLDMVASTIYNYNEVMAKYLTLMQSFFANRILPQGVAYTKDMVRRVIVLSDTDSTCGTYDHWVVNVLGKQDFGPFGTAIAATAMTIVGGVIENLINVFTTNMNVGTKSKGLLEMKNEYYWKTFAIGSGTKHYYAMVNVKEGFAFNEYKLELKGSQLIASKSPLKYREKRNAMIQEINERITSNKKIDVAKYIRDTLALETELYGLIAKGDTSMLENVTIKDKSSYSRPESSPYSHYGMWEDVFAVKYGHMDPPPYDGCKFNVNLNSKREINEFVSQIEDKNIREKFDEWRTRTNKNKITNFLIPKDCILTHGIPEELLKIGNITRLIVNALSPLYLVLATIGVQTKNKSTLTEMGYELTEDNN